MPFKVIYYFELRTVILISGAEPLVNFDMGNYEEYSEIILNLNLWFRRCHVYVIYYLELWQ